MTALPYLAVVGQTVISAGTFLIGKVGLGDVGAAQLFSLRVLLASPLLALMLARARPRFAPREHLALAGLGLLGVPCNQGLLLWGLESTTPTRTALLFAMTPLVVMLVAHRVLGEPLGRRRLVGIALGFGGVLVVLLDRGLSFEGAALRGELLVTAAVLAWSLYSVYGKRLAERHGTLAVTAASLLWGTFLSAPIEVWALVGFEPSALPERAWWSVAYLAVFTSVVAYALWHFALGRLPAGRVAIFINLQPVLTGIFSVALLGEALTAPLMAGGALVVAGVVLVQRG